MWAALALEAGHCFNTLWVKNRWRNWEIHSQLDSCMFHTLIFANIARYFREFSWIQFAVFFAARCFFENLPEHIGGLVPVKAILEGRRKGHVAECLYLSGAYATCLLLSFGILMREQVLNQVFVGNLVLAFPLTLLQASRYMFNKSSMNFWGAHLANCLTLNPVLLAALLRMFGIIAST